MKKDWFLVSSNILMFVVAYLLFSGSLQALGLAFTGESFLDSDYNFSANQQLLMSFLDLVAASVLTWYFLKRSGISFKRLGLKFSANQFLQSFVLGGIFRCAVLCRLQYF